MNTHITQNNEEALIITQRAPPPDVSERSHDYDYSVLTLSPFKPVDDSTSVCECNVNQRDVLHFEELQVGTRVKVLGEFCTKLVFNELQDKIRVHKLCTLTLSEECNHFLECFLYFRERESGSSTMEVEEEDEQARSEQSAAVQERKARRFRSLLLDFLFELVANGVKNFENTERARVKFDLADLLRHEAIREHLLRDLDIRQPNQQEFHLTFVLADFERVNLLKSLNAKNLLQFHKNSDLVRKEYDVNIELLVSIKKFLYFKIEQAGVKGDTFRNLFTQVNRFISTEIFFLSRELVLKLLDEFYRKCLIYQSTSFRYHVLN